MSTGEPISDAMQRYKTAQELTVPKWAIEKAVRQLGKLPAIALVRAAYGADLKDAQVIHNALCSTPVRGTP